MGQRSVNCVTIGRCCCCCCCVVGCQIVASSSTSYSIPWPASFQRLQDVMKVFLVDIISITRTNCAQPMNYFDSLVVLLVGVKVVLLLVRPVQGCCKLFWAGGESTPRG